MDEQAGDEALGHLREAELVARVVERVDVALEEREVGVHARALDAGERLGHEGGVHAALERHLLDDELERHHVVRHRQGVGVAEVDLVLAGAVLVVAVAHGDAHLLEGEDGALAQVAGHV